MLLDYDENGQEESQAQNKMRNEIFFEKIASTDPVLVKEAQDSVKEFTRRKMREEGFARKVLPILPVENSDLDRAQHTDKPQIIIDKEPDSPAAISVPLATLPMTWYIRGPRYIAMFERILSPRFTKDTDELRTWIMDIRQVLSDNAIKDMLAEEDSKFITACNNAMGGAVDTTVSLSGQVQWKSLSGGVTRENLSEMLKVMPSGSTNLEVHTILINHITVNDLAKFGFNEQGGDTAQDILRKGYSEQELFGRRLLVTIKKALVPNQNFYHFASPKYFGKHFALEDTTMYIRREAYMLEFFAYQLTAMAIGNTSGVCRVVMA